MTRPHEGFFSWFDLGGAEHAWGELSFARDISIAGRLDEPPVLRRLGQNRSRRGENGLADRQAGCVAVDEWLERVSSLGCHLEACAQAVDFKLLRLEPEAALAPCRRCERRPALFDPLMVRKNRVIEAPSNFSDERAELLNN